MIQTISDIKKNVVESCDVCVVGSGAGGSVMAKELVEAGFDVVLLEEGGYYRTEDFNVTDTITSLERLYRDGGTTAMLGKPNVLYVEGRCVGGSTTINGGMCWRTPEKILKRWQWENGLADLNPKNMEFYFKRVEEMLHVSPVHPISRNEDAELLKKGADILGYRVKPNIRNHHTCVGANQCITGCPTGGKKTPLLTYIPAFLNKGGRLYANAKVKKVRLRNGHAAGVEGTIGRHKIRVHSKITVVCGGAIQTPALLMRSGVSDPSKLLGRNLFIHPNVKVMGVFDQPVMAWKGVNQAYQVTEFMDEGILMGVNFVPPGIFSLAVPFHGKGSLEKIRDMYNYSVVGAALIEDTSRGRVINLPFGQTIATYHLNEMDFKLALRAIALLAEIYFAAGAKRVYLPLQKLHEIHSIDDIRKVYEYPVKLTDLELMTVHVMGTAQMGTDTTRSVVDAHGEMHDVPGLFVADASVFPTSIGVNPQITIMALATRTAFYLAENKHLKGNR